MSGPLWVCIRQRAGPFVKAFSTDNYRFVNRCRSRSSINHALSGTPLDRLELRLALFGYDGIFYTLTFSAELFTRIFADTQFLCTECALLRSAQNGSGHAE